jgi:hypothetical protein
VTLLIFSLSLGKKATYIVAAANALSIACIDVRE